MYYYYINTCSNIMSVLDLVFKRISVMSTLQEQFNQKIQSFLEITKVYLECLKVVEVGYPEVGVDSYDKEHIFQERQPSTNLLFRQKWLI